MPEVNEAQEISYDGNLMVMRKGGRSNESIHVEPSEYKGQMGIDIRTYFMPRDEDVERPTREGVRLNPEQALAVYDHMGIVLREIGVL